jgi:hypothetical protein
VRGLEGNEGEDMAGDAAWPCTPMYARCLVLLRWVGRCPPPQSRRLVCKAYSASPVNNQEDALRCGSPQLRRCWCGLCGCQYRETPCVGVGVGRELQKRQALGREA